VKALGAALQRQDGVAYHWGGDEFMLFLPGADRVRLLEAARNVARDLLAFGADGEFIPSASFGCTFVPTTDARSPEEIAAAADEALYRAKGADRSRLAIEGEEARDLL
jgi:diguanylate cyclase (GGDEF)-like protein